MKKARLKKLHAEEGQGKRHLCVSCGWNSMPLRTWSCMPVALTARARTTGPLHSPPVAIQLFPFRLHRFVVGKVGSRERRLFGVPQAPPERQERPQQPAPQEAVLGPGAPAPPRRLVAHPARHGLHTGERGVVRAGAPCSSGRRRRCRRRHLPPGASAHSPRQQHQARSIAAVCGFTCLPGPHKGRFTRAASRYPAWPCWR